MGRKSRRALRDTSAAAAAQLGGLAVRIHFFTDYFRPEPPPPAHHIAERARIWATQGHDVTIVTNHPNYPEGRLYAGHRNAASLLQQLDGYSVLRVWTHIAEHQARLGKLIDHASFCASASLQAMRLPKPDVVVATSPHLFCGLAGAWYAALRRRPFLLEVRDLWPDSVLPKASAAFRVFKCIERHLYRRAQAVSVLTPAFERHVLREGARRAVTIIGGVDLTKFTPGDPPPQLRRDLGLQDKFVVGYPGTLGTAHDAPLLLEAARQLKGSRVRFLLIGGGPFMRYLESAAREVCPDMIHFVPTQRAEVMPDWWRMMDAGLVLLKKTELMRTVIPSKMFECMATQKPILFVGPQGVGSAVVEDSDCGVVIDGDGPEHLAREALSLSQDVHRYQVLSKNALSASPIYSRDRQAERTMRLLREIVAEAQVDSARSRTDTPSKSR
jgi:colanic acid biosynthesis glycosyl transferase WcaI